MRELYTTNNIFDLPTGDTEAVCITTNGMVKKNGHAVMGAGIAKEANIRYHVSKDLAAHLNAHGNIPCLLPQTGENGCHLITFPTKTDWRDKSDIQLIRRSAALLKDLCDTHGVTRCFLVPPGCGLGGLSWNQVKLSIKDILDDRFIVVFRNTAQ